MAGVELLLCRFILSWGTSTCWGCSCFKHPAGSGHRGWGETGILLSVSLVAVCVFSRLLVMVTMYLCYELDDSQKRGADEKDPMVHLESVYQELLSKKCPEKVQSATSDPCLSPSLTPQGAVTEESSLPDQEEQAEQAGSPNVSATEPQQSPPRPVVIREQVEFVPEEEILRNRLSEEELRKIPKFSSYHPGEPSKVS